MTVIEAERTGGRQDELATPKVDAIVNSLTDPVWALLRAGQLDAALVLLAANARKFEEAWRVEYVGIPAAPAPQEVTRTGCTSMLHAGRDCPSALAEGLLKEDVPFCEHCSGLQLEQEPAPTRVAETGTRVHIVTTVGTSKVSGVRKAS